MRPPTEGESAPPRRGDVTFLLNAGGSGDKFRGFREYFIE